MKLDTGQLGAVLLPEFSSQFTEQCVTASFFLWVGFDAAANCMNTPPWEFAEGLLDEMEHPAFAQ